MDKKYKTAEIRPESNGHFLNRHWIEYHATNALHIGESLIRGVKCGRIGTAKRIVKAIIPVYRQMNVAWNGCCCSEKIKLGAIPEVLLSEWSQLPLDYWNYHFITGQKCGMVKIQNRKRHDRKIPAFLKESLLQDLSEGMSEFKCITQFSENIMQIRIALAHSYRHINFAVNSAISMTLKDFRNFDDHDNSTIPVFDDFSRWPEAAVRELGPEWVIELQERQTIALAK